ncbi:MAG: alpha/beta fold hydrolase [Acidobacteriota bacterium]|nr:alpha/beta fold hydrolase [Acidobacteriota bacterium]
MRKRRRLGVYPLTLAALALAPTVLGAAPQPVQFRAADGVTVYGDFYSNGRPHRPLILLFHQAGSNRGEYATIAPRLVGAGFNCLAIDQRAGGEMWGRKNETVEHLGHSAPYLEAERDLQAALDWARSRKEKGKVILWGSSYSASLVFALAAHHPDEVSGLLAFSPGEYFEHKDMIRQAAAQVHVPVFITCGGSAQEAANARPIYEAVASKEKVFFIPPIGVHGSKTLRTDSDPKGAAGNWREVLSFLKKNFG